MSIRFWIRNKIKHYFDFVDRIDNDRVWTRRREDVERYSVLARNYESLSLSFTRLSMDFEQERKIGRELLLTRAINNTAPLECMERALSALKALPDHLFDRNGLIGKAINELEHGLHLIKEPKLKGANNGK